MKISLRFKYLAWLVLFMLLCMGVNVGLDLLHENLPSAWSRAGQLGDESHEIQFMVLSNLILMPTVVFIGWKVARWMLNPLQDFARAARRIGQGDMHARIASEPADGPIHEIGQTLNAAFDRLESSAEQARRFSGNAAHQLRTPLAELRGLGELCLHKDRTPSEYRDTLRTMLDRVDHLHRLTEQLLELSKIESDQKRERIERVDLSRLVRECATEFSAVFQERGIAFSIAVPPDLSVPGSPTLLSELLTNLLDNAACFCPSGGSTEVRLSRNGNVQIVLEVEDSGPGIPARDAAIIFERFAQGSRPSEKGTGLGLAIVAEIARAHGGTAEATHGTLGGALFRITLPAATG